MQPTSLMAAMVAAMSSPLCRPLSQASCMVNAAGGSPSRKCWMAQAAPQPPPSVSQLFLSSATMSCARSELNQIMARYMRQKATYGRGRP